MTLVKDAFLCMRIALVSSVHANLNQKIHHVNQVITSILLDLSRHFLIILILNKI